jgi:two-component system sensor histidine kinase HydH
MRPLKMAIIIAGAFFVASALYITASDWLVLHLVGSREELNALQSLKGLAYITTVSAVFFVGLYYLLRRIAGHVEEIQTKKDLLLERERKAMVGTMAASIVHDINNLLGAIRPNLRYTLDSTDLPDDAREAIEDAQLATEELVEMAQRLKNVSKQHQDEHRSEVDVGEFTAETVEMLAPHASLRHCAVECDCDRGTRLELYPSLLRHALINLLLNASDATDRRGHIRIALATSAETVELSVEDDGPGIPEEERDAVRHPFATSKAEGLGLGIFAVTYCARIHGGTFTIDDAELGGSKMRLTFPTEKVVGFV